MGFTKGGNFASAAPAAEAFVFATDLVVYLSAHSAANYTLVAGKMTAWNDLSGNANHFVAGTTTVGPTFDATLFDNKGGMKFLPSSPASAITSAAITPTTQVDNMTVFYVIERNTSAQGPLLVNYEDEEYLTWFPGLSCMGWNQPVIGTTRQRMALDTPMIYAAVSTDDGITKHYIGDLGPFETYIGNTGHTYSGPIQKLSIAKAAGQGGTGDANIGMMALYKRAFTTTEVFQCIDYIKFTLGWNVAHPNPTHNIVLDGNSHVVSYGEVSDSVWSVAIADEMSLTEDNFSMTAYGGSTNTELVARAEAVVDSLYDSSKTHNICFLWEGTNELCKVDATVDSVWDLYVTYINARIFAGFEMVVGTILPRTTTKPAYEADRITLNQRIRDNAASMGYTVADLGGTGNGIGDSGDELGAHYADGIHLDASGQGIVVDILAPVFAALIA
jgi:hypothetical protein